MDYSKNKKYFSSTGCLMIILYLIAWWFIAMICTAILVQIMGEQTGPLIGALVSIVAIVLIVIFVNKRKMTDAQYEAIVKEQLKAMEQRALDKLGIDIDEVKEIAPIVIDGYNYDNFTMYKKGKDGVWRTNMYKVIYLFFSQNEVHSYTCEFCTTEEQKKEFTDVYFYQDIVSASTESSTATFKNGEKVQYESFKLTTSGGTSLFVSISDSDHAQRSISAMRQLLRAKKLSS